MNLHPQKRLLRTLAAATLLLWVIAQITCFVHCHYPDRQISGAEKKCCSARNASNPENTPAGGNAACMAFKNVTLSGKTALLNPPDLSLLAFTIVPSVEAFQPTPADLIRPVPFHDSGPPLLSLFELALISLPPPALA